MFDLFLKIFGNYQNDLKKDKSIDFDDMIIEGREKLQIEDFKYVIVDEFQDISQGRAKFLKRIKERNNAKLYCVGDDWRAINQFSGGDVTIFTKDFENLYGHFERVDIDTTNVAFGNRELIFETRYNLADDTPVIERYISNRDKIRAFIVELKMAEREMKKQIDSYYEENSTPLNK